jgi:HEAT repeat protein
MSLQWMLHTTELAVRPAKHRKSLGSEIARLMDLRQYAEQLLSELRFKGPTGERAACALEFVDHAILPILGEALKSERDAEVRERIIEIIGQHRVSSAIPILAEALFDESPLVWKKALDALVTLDRPECVPAIEAARNRAFRRQKDSEYFQEWADEAIQQLREGVFWEKKDPKASADIADD